MPASPAATPIAVREAEPRDVEAAAALFAQLGYPTDAATVRAWLPRISGSATDRLLVMTCADERVLALASIHVIPMVHYPAPMGRITALVVDEAARGHGIGAQLLAAAEAALWALGCGRIELTSRDTRSDAHRFYERHGYRTESRRFVKDCVAGGAGA